MQVKIVKIALVGGGLCNCLLLKYLKDQNLKNQNINFQVTLISENEYTFYSGMLPGLLIKQYHLDDISIQLKALCIWSYANYVFRNVKLIVPEENKLVLNDNSIFIYDICVINIGGYTKGINSILGAQQYAIATRPVLTSIQKIEESERQFKINGIIPTVVVIGGGLAGLEFAFSLQTRWSDYFKVSFIKITILQQQESIQVDKNYIKQLDLLLKERHIKIIYNVQAIEVKQECAIYKDLINQKIFQISASVTILATGAECSDLFAKSGMETDANGYLIVNNYMQSIQYNNIFAAGDCSQIQKYMGTCFPPKAGMYSLAAAPVISKNIQIIASNLKCTQLPIQLTLFKPQQSFLVIENICNKKCFGFKNGLFFYGKWVWQLKNYMDRGLMNLFDFKQLFSRYDQFSCVRNEDSLTRSNFNEFDNLNLQNYKEQIEKLQIKEMAYLLSLQNENSKSWELQWFIIEKADNDEQFQNQLRQEILTLNQSKDQ